MQLVAIADDDETVRDAVELPLDYAGFSTAAFAPAEMPAVGASAQRCMPGHGPVHAGDKRGPHLTSVVAAGLLIACTGAQANEVPGYGLASAAREITQLFWLAETANVCGWATPGDADWFKVFSMRFLSDHLSERNRLALVSMVTQDGYEKAVRQAAQDGAGENCVSRRWELGWASYLSAAVAHGSEQGGTR